MRYNINWCDSTESVTFGLIMGNVLILSVSNDTATDEVVDWLAFYKQKVVRVNYGQWDSFDFEWTLDDGVLLFNGKKILDVTATWFRRGFLLEEISGKDSIEGHLLLEKQSIVRLFYSQLILKNHIGHPFKSRLDKLDVLAIAHQIGFSIPKSLYSSDFTKVKAFSTAMKSGLVTKPVTDAPVLVEAGQHRVFYTSSVESDDLDRHLAPALFQERIDAELEIRVFFLKGRSYSMAIFPESSKLDIRSAWQDGHLVSSPYQLPEAIEDKIDKLMSKIGLNCGSIDLLLGKNGLYYFLEVNPVGQFQFLSKLCGYGLEREIARLLAEK